jgi:hypothetical protein
MSKALKLLQDRLDSFDEWRASEQRKIDEQVDQLKQLQESIDSKKKVLQVKENEMSFLRELLEAMITDESEKTMSASSVYGLIEDKVTANQCFRAVGIELEEIADENTQELDDDSEPIEEVA